MSLNRVVTDVMMNFSNPPLAQNISDLLWSVEVKNVRNMYISLKCMLKEFLSFQIAAAVL